MSSFAEALGEDALDLRIRELRSRRRRLNLIGALAAAALITWLLFGVIFGLAVVRGPSMQPAYQEGDLVLFTRITRKVRQGDVILFRQDGEEHIKRVMALAGQSIEIAKDGVIVNGEMLLEPYVFSATDSKEGKYPLIVPQGCVFVLGDFRENSKDSRNYGPISFDDVTGKVLLVIRRQS